MSFHIAHYIAGVLDRDPMVETVGSLTQSTGFAPGDRVKTLRGSLRGIVVRVLEDGRFAVRADALLFRIQIRVEIGLGHGRCHARFWDFDFRDP